MRFPWSGGLFLALLCLFPARGAEPVGSWLSVVPTGPHSSLIQRAVPLRGAAGEVATISWVRLEDGLNYWDEERSAWIESREEIRLMRPRPLALHGQQRASFSANANDPEGAVIIELGPDIVLRSSVLALKYYDVASGREVVLAVVKDAAGELLPPNQMIYRDAFDRIKADVVYTYRKRGTEADVVLRELPPLPSEVGLDPTTTLLQVVTEFFDPPAPTNQRQQLRQQQRAFATLRKADLGGGGVAEEPDWADQELEFGQHRMARGRAFAWSAREVAQAQPEDFPAISKRWYSLEDGREILVESADYLALLQQLLALPGDVKRREALRDHAPLWAGKKLTEPRLDAFRRWAQAKVSEEETRHSHFPLREFAQSGSSDHEIQLADAGAVNQPGLVLDWSLLVAGASNFTFSATNTYHVTGDCSFKGTTTLEGGAVLKFPQHSNGIVSGITIRGPLVCKTSLYRPAIFTADSDNTIGESIVSGVPSSTADYGTFPLRFDDVGSPVIVEHLQFRYGLNGISFQGDTPDNRIRHTRFLRVRNPVRSAAATPVTLENVLIRVSKTSGIVFQGAGTAFTGEHLTIHDAPNLLTGGTLTLVNSLIVGVANVPPYTSIGSFEVSSSAGLFETVGAGAYYLPIDSPHRNAGTPAIDPTLAIELGSLTTEAPQVINADVTADTTWQPVVERDMDVPDRGYHYPPLDYLVSDRRVAYATLQLEDGVTVGVYGSSGLLLGNGARLVSIGLPDALNRIVHYSLAQEQPNTSMVPSMGSLGLLELNADPNPPQPEVSLVFTEAAMPAGVRTRRQLFRSVNASSLRLEAMHSHLVGVDFAPNGSQPGTTLSLLNNRIEDCVLTISDTNEPGFHPVTLSAHNNLFRSGYFQIRSERGDSSWTIRDNVFDPVFLSVTTLNGVFSHNGFRAGLPVFGADSRTGLTMDFASGPPTYRYPNSGGANSLATLVNAGSRSASAAGLYHFSVLSEDAPELATTVDIGFHHPAAAPSGEVALDTDRDGIPDALEDLNGNGIQDAGETSPADLDSDYDGRTDGDEKLDGTDPLNPASVKPVLLAAWPFDDATDPWRGSNGSEPIEQTALTLVEISPSVHSVEMTSSAAVLRYRDVETNGAANINCRQGTIRIAFSPYWASSSSVCTSGNGGNGPGVEITLLSIGGFSLGIDKRGTNFFFRAPDSAGGVVTCAQAPLRMCAGEYPPDFALEIQVSYSTNGSAIFYNRELKSRGIGVPGIPDRSSRAQGLFIGSATNRTGQVKGLIDSLVTFNAPLDLSTNTLFLTATPELNPPSITLNWSAISNTYYRIERRTRLSPEWTLIGSFRPPTFTDTNVVIGREYEYRVGTDSHVPADLFPFADPLHATVLTGIRLPPKVSPGHALLIVDRTLTNNLTFSRAADALTRDLWSEGWVVTRYNGPRHDDVVWANNPARMLEVKGWIQSYAAAHPGQVQAIVLLGHLPIPRSGMINPDGHGYRPLPTDLYYADFDGPWTDATNWIATPGVITPNIAGDGIFDQELVPPNGSGIAAVEAAVGRIDFARMPVFATGSAPRSEVDLISQYVTKARKFRRRDTVLPERVVYGSYFTANGEQERFDGLGHHLQKLATRIDAAVGGVSLGTRVEGDFFVAQEPATWGILGGYGGGYHVVHSLTAVNLYHGIVPHFTADLISDAGEPPIAFSVMEASFINQWDEPDHIGRGLLATRNYGLTWCYAGSTRVEWQFPAMAMGLSVGEAWVRTHNDAWNWALLSMSFGSGYGTGVRVFGGSRTQGGYIYGTLLGDPTLRSAPVSPPASVSGSTNAPGDIVLSWGASPDTGVQYQVYRSSAGVGGKWRPLTEVGVTSRTFTDTEPVAGAVYMVRSVALKTTGSGSFTNLSAGTIWP